MSETEQTDSARTPKKPDFKTDDRVKRGNLIKVRPQDVEIQEGFNLRSKSRAFQETVARYTHAILHGAQMPPLKVRYSPDRRIIVRDGERRLLAYLAAIEAGAPIEYIEVIEHKGNEVDDVLLMIGTADHNSELTPLEKGRGYKRLRQYGWSVGQIAEHWNRSSVHVSDLLLLADAPVAIHQLIEEETVASYTAIEAIKQHGDNAINVLTDAGAAAADDGRGKIRPADVTKARGDAPPKLQLFKPARRAEVVKSFSDLRDIVAKQVPEPAKVSDDALVEVPYSLLSQLLRLAEEDQKKGKASPAPEVSEAASEEPSAIAAD